MIANKNPYIDEAYSQLKVISQDKQKRQEYEERKKAIRDFNAFFSQGKEEGKIEGKKEGKIEGKEEGKIEGKIEVAKNSLKIGLSIEQIVLITGLDKNTIITLQNNLNSK